MANLESLVNENNIVRRLLVFMGQSMSAHYIDRTTTTW